MRSTTQRSCAGSPITPVRSQELTDGYFHLQPAVLSHVVAPSLAGSGPERPTSQSGGPLTGISIFACPGWHLYTPEGPSPRNFLRRTIVKLRRPSPQPALTGDRLEPLLSGHSSDTAPHLRPFFARRTSLHPPRVSLPGAVVPRSLRSMSPNSPNRHCSNRSSGCRSQKVVKLDEWRFPELIPNWRGHFGLAKPECERHRRGHPESGDGWGQDDGQD